MFLTARLNYGDFNYYKKNLLFPLKNKFIIINCYSQIFYPAINKICLLLFINYIFYKDKF
jgi:hypothetical protein